MILVTGATGRVGRHVVARLRERGVPFKALVRDSTKASSLAAHVHVVAADFRRPETIMSALQGIERLLIVTPAIPDQAISEKGLIDVASNTGVRHVVKLSVMGADESAPFRFGRSHGEVEEYLRDTELDWTFVRPNRYFQNFLGLRELIVEQGCFYGCQGDGAVSMIDVDDVAAVIAEILETGGHAGDVLTLTGPEALTPNEQAATLSKYTGRRVTYVDLPPASLKRTMISSGASPWLADAITQLYEFYRDGGAVEVTSDVRKLLGRDPRSFAQWCDQNSEALR